MQIRKSITITNKLRTSHKLRKESNNITRKMSTGKEMIICRRNAKEQ